MLSNPHLFDLNNSRLASIDRVGNAGAWLETTTTTTYTVTKYYSLAGQRVAMRQGTTVNYLYGDHLGSTSLISDAAGSTISETRYEPYGQVYWQWGATQTDFGFTGQRMDGFGLMDYNARYYDPMIGRFISSDTLIPQPGNPLAWDRYAYVNSNPINSVDPSGHMPACYEVDICGPVKKTSTNKSLGLISKLPVNKDEIQWIQWYGGTEYAYNDHINYVNGEENWNYDGYCQGYHCGIDLGAEWGTDVYAGTYGTVINSGRDNGGYYIIIKLGDYHIYYQGLDGEFNVSVGDSVYPNTRIAGVGNHAADPSLKNTHVHMEIRYSSSGSGDYKDRISNPLLFMDMTLYQSLRSMVPYSPKDLTTFHAPEKDPLKQRSPIVRGGASLWQ